MVAGCPAGSSLGDGPRADGAERGDPRPAGHDSRRERRAPRHLDPGPVGLRDAPVGDRSAERGRHAGGGPGDAAGSAPAAPHLQGLVGLDQAPRGPAGVGCRALARSPWDRPRPRDQARLSRRGGRPRYHSGGAAPGLREHRRHGTVRGGGRGKSAPRGPAGLCHRRGGRGRAADRRSRHRSMAPM
jgi:hypothetical protein